MNWTIYTTFSLIFMLIIIGFALYQGIKLAVLYNGGRGRAEFRQEIRSYKYGKFLWVYLFAFPLFIMSFAYSGLAAPDCIFKGLTDAFKLVGLQFDFDLALRAADPIYNAAIITAYTVATLNVVMFIISCLNQASWTFFGNWKFKHSRKNRCLIIGADSNSQVLYNSIDSKKLNVRKTTIDILSKDQKWNLFANNIRYVAKSDNQKLKQYIKKLINDQNKKYIKWNNGNKNDKNFPKLQIILNFPKNTINVEYCCFLSEVINNLKNSKDENGKICLSYIDIYVYCDSEHINVYESYIIALNGCLHLIDEKKIVAYDFIDKYPIAKYLTKDQIDFKTSLINDGVNIDVNFIGFGNTSQRIFTSLFSNTQFVKKDGKKGIKIKPVNFHVYDKQNRLESKYFQQTFNRYKSIFLDKNKKFDSSKYLELPTLNNFIPHVGDENDINFTNTVNEFNKRINTKNNDLHYIIVSLGNDFESIDVANRIWKNIVKNGLTNCYLFLRIKDKQSCIDTIETIEKNNIKEEIIALNSQYHVFGCLSDTIFNYDRIINDNITKLGILQSIFYTFTNKSLSTKNKCPINYLDLNDDIVEDWRGQWSEKNEYDRYSSIIAALNLRSKLLMMGLDYVPINDSQKGEFETFNEYWDYLDKENKPTLSEFNNIKDIPLEIIDTAKKENENISDADIVKDVNNKLENGEILSLKYGLNHKKNSRRWKLVNLEHNRWNAFMVATGYIPLEIDNIKSGKDGHKDLTNFKHACITTMSGLEELNRILAILNCECTDDKKTFSKKEKYFNGLEEIEKADLLLENDKINFDYLQYDSAWHVLNAIGYKIVRSPNNQKK